MYWTPYLQLLKLVCFIVANTWKLAAQWTRNCFQWTQLLPRSLCGQLVGVFINIPRTESHKPLTNKQIKKTLHGIVYLKVQGVETQRNHMAYLAMGFSETWNWYIYVPIHQNFDFDFSYSLKKSYKSKLKQVNKKQQQQRNTHKTNAYSQKINSRKTI